jgi:hypothetical protein
MRRPILLINLLKLYRDRMNNSTLARTLGEEARNLFNNLGTLLVGHKVSYTSWS